MKSEIEQAYELSVKAQCAALGIENNYIKNDKNGVNFFNSMVGNDISTDIIQRNSISKKSSGMLSSLTINNNDITKS